jgi:hypothetical protein
LKINFNFHVFKKHENVNTAIVVKDEFLTKCKSTEEDSDDGLMRVETRMSV